MDTLRAEIIAEFNFANFGPIPRNTSVLIIAKFLLAKICSLRLHIFDVTIFEVVDFSFFVLKKDLYFSFLISLISGHCEKFDEIVYEGDVEKMEFAAYYFR